MKPGIITFFMITWFSLDIVLGQTIQHTYRFFDDLTVAAPECGPDLIAYQNVGSCNAGSSGGDYLEDTPPCRVKRKVYKNALNWGLSYPNTANLVNDTYTIQLYFKITEWSTERARILDFSNGTNADNISFTKSPGSNERCLDFGSRGIVGDCPFFNTNNYYLLTISRDGQTNTLDIYVNDALFASLNDAEKKYVNNPHKPVHIFVDDRLNTCESARAHFAYLAFSNTYTSATEVTSQYNEICFTANINAAADFSIDPNPSCGFPENITVNYSGSIPEADKHYDYQWDWDGGKVVSGTGRGPYVVNWNTPGSKNVTLTVTHSDCSNPITNTKLATISSLDLATNVVNPSCTDPNATISVTAIEGNGPFQYSINEVDYQDMPTFRVPADTYRVSVKDANNCISMKEVVIPAVETISVTTVNDTTVCEGQSVSLQTTSNADSFSWQPSTDLDDPSAKDPVATPHTTTEYIVTANKNGCVVTDKVRITVVPKIVLNVTPDTEIEAELPFQLQVSSPQLDGSPGATYSWLPPTGLSDPQIANPTTILRSNQVYFVRGTSSDGCFAEARVRITVSPPDWIEIPTAFTPNGDGINDVLQVISKGIQHFHYFKIFNRWGQLVFSTTTPTDGWDGRFKGADPVGGTYLYQVMGVSSKGKIIQKDGNVLLMK